jgi:hypothetical protein
MKNGLKEKKKKKKKKKKKATFIFISSHARPGNWMTLRDRWLLSTPPPSVT